MSRSLTRLRRVHIGAWIAWWQVQFKVEDMWVGLFWQTYPGKVYVWICLLPCVPLHVELWKPGTGARPIPTQGEEGQE